MSVSQDDLVELARQIFEFANRDFDVVTGNDASTVLGLSLTASEDTIRSRFRDLVVLVHPDSSPFEDVSSETQTKAFDILTSARDSLIELSREDITEEEAATARARGAPESPGTGGWGPFAEEKQSQYRQTFEQVKIFYAEEFLGKSIDAETFDRAVETGQVTQENIEFIDDTLREQFGVPELTLDDIARVLASLIVTGSIRLGNIERMADRSSVFAGKGGVFGPGDDSAFTRRSSKRRGQGRPFK